MAEILIIDPKSEERALLREQLESAGHDVMESAEPESGLAKAFEHKPDIVIASMGSSPTSGLELAYRVASAGKKPLPAFLLYTSAQFDEEELEQAVRCGVHGVIPRGADNSTVLQLVAASLDSPLVERRLADRREYDIIVKSLLSSTVAKIIEELRGAVEASKNAETQFQDLLEAIPDALVGIDSTGIIRFVNRQAESLFGYSRTEMLGLPMAGFIAPGDRENHESRRLDDFHFAEEGKFQTRCRELAIVDKQAREIHTDINISFVHFGTCLMILASLRDISGRVADEARRSRLEADLNRAKRHSSLGELAGGVAHDFNNLLGAILNYASIMESELKSASCGKGNLVSALADLEQINKAARTATQLTRRLLTFAKREVSQSETINVGNAICEARDFLGHTLGEHVSVKIKERFNPLFVNIDPGQFEQILVNLAVNARDAMPDGGNLRIEVGLVDFDLGPQECCNCLGRSVLLRFIDTGCGMEESTIERAFEPFFSTKGENVGTGLGLAIVYGIVSQAGGSVHIASKPGNGTTISVLLPACEGSEIQRPVGLETRKAGRGETILVVEDDEAMRDSTERILNGNGYRVVAVPGPLEALGLINLEGANFDLVLSDVVMPTMMGTELADSINEIRPDIPILFMSGYAHPGVNSRVSLGHGLIEKPFRTSMLLERIESILATERDRSLSLSRS